MAEEKATATATAAAPSPKIAQILDLVSVLTLLEASELVKAFEQKFGVSAAPVAVAAAGAAAGAGAAAAPKEEEKTSFTVVLKEAGANKIQVIKAVRAVTTLGLKEAKALVDGAPGTIKEGATKEEAAKIKDEVEKSGGKIEIK
jgi:large subunit ribosomal protein L7/L12